MHKDIVNWRKNCKRCITSKPKSLKAPIEKSNFYKTTDDCHRLHIVGEGLQWHGKCLRDYTIAVPTKDEKAVTVPIMLVEEWLSWFGPPKCGPRL